MPKVSRHKSFTELKASDKTTKVPVEKLQEEYREFIAELQAILAKSKSEKRKTQ